jgi:uncharacterized YccA/Bax inhibitor family protein
LLNHIELILSAAGILVIIVVPTVLSSFVGDVWRVATVTATFVGVLHGLIFWLIRRRQRQLRSEAVREIKTMLNEVVKDQLAIIMVNAQLARPEEKRMQQIQQSVDRIVESVDHISSESLLRWQQIYRSAPSATQS